MARSACDVARRTRRSELFHDRLLESRQFDSPGTDARHTRKRTAHADQPTDRDRRQFSVGLSRNDVLLVFISLLWSRLFRRRVSRQLLSRSRFSVTHDLRARLSRHSLSEFRDGLQTWRSVRHLSRRRLGAFLRSLLPNAITKTIRRTKTRQHLAPTSCNLRTRRHSSGLDRRPRARRSQRAAHYTALFSRGVASLFALGFRTCSQTRQMRGQSPPILTTKNTSQLSLLVTFRGVVYHRQNGARHRRKHSRPYRPDSSSASSPLRTTTARRRLRKNRMAQSRRLRERPCPARHDSRRRRKGPAKTRRHDHRADRRKYRDRSRPRGTCARLPCYSVRPARFGGREDGTDRTARR